MSNEANLKGRSCAWLIFGVNNRHEIIGSRYRTGRKDLDSLKKEIGDKTTQSISFMDIYELQKPEGRVVMFQIPAAPHGIPVSFEGFYYGRLNESLIALNIEKIDRIRNQAANRDWSREIVPDATIADLDKEAILKAREQYKLRNPSLEKEVDSWDETHTKVTVYGELIDENYTNILYNHPELSLEDVIALDKVQKKQPVGEIEMARLRELKLLAENTLDNNTKFAQTGGMTGGMTGGISLSETQIKILNLIKENPKISFKKMEEILEINISALQKHIEKLKQQGIITREGAAFGGYWQIMK